MYNQKLNSLHLIMKCVNDEQISSCELTKQVDESITNAVIRFLRLQLKIVGIYDIGAVAGRDLKVRAVQHVVQWT